MKRIFLFSLFSLSALADSSPVTYGGFIDTYYAFDVNQPKKMERDFTTQPVRHNEANVNLAYLEAVLKQEKTRGRLALQYGNSVSKNYSTEVTNGPTSGPQDAKNLQEAYVGTKVGEKTWIDLGVFLGNIGSESWISKDNWTYTRSLNSDYVPYYSSGLRIEHQISNSQSFQIQLLNGWQNISETNSGKAIGMQYKNSISPAFTFTYSNFFGDEEVVPNQVTTKTNPRFRAYHNFNFLYLISDKWHFLTVLDWGHQAQQNNDGVDTWYNGIVTLKHNFDPSRSMSLRLEYYNDRHQANIATGTPDGFQVTGASVNYDLRPEPNVLWRTELRGFHSKDKIYPKKTSEKNDFDGFIVTSLSVWF